MSPILWFTALGLVLAATVAILWATPAFRRRAARKFATRVGLTLDDGTAPRVTAQLTRRALAGLVGYTSGLLVSVGTLLAVGRPTGTDTMWSWVVTGSVFTGMGIGASLATLTQRLPQPGAAVRVARSRELVVEDYLTRYEVAFARLVGPVALALVALAWIATSGGPRTEVLLPTATAAALGTLATQLMFELGSRLVLRRPIRGESPHDLAWDDALRADSLRQLLLAPYILGVVGTGWALFSLMTVLPTTVGLVVVNLAMPLVVASGIAVLVVVLVRQPERHYLRRLWPDLHAEMLDRERAIASSASAA
ncbi:hypothetical protein [Pseudolysinimonas sp.]|jgi:hypothetical protein|uniref:hypothetical protein n=1 Tax=Pseudolysinimonas sp. TaxID=2680009 RepID=UPI003784DB4F